MARKPISTRTRFEILKRDGFRCAYCGTTPLQTQAPMHVDHVVPVAEGGTDDPENLITACAPCNMGKSSVPLKRLKYSQPQSIKDAQEHMEDVRAYLEVQKEIAKSKRAAQDEFARHWEELIGPLSQQFYERIPALLAGNNLELLYECVGITASKWGNPGAEYEWSDALRQQKYFYGVLRNRKPGGKYFDGQDTDN